MRLMWIFVGLTWMLTFTGVGLAQRPSITVTNPNTRVILDPGTKGTANHTITWRSSGFLGNVDVQLSRNNGTNWENLFLNIPNSGSIAWTISGAATEKALVRVRRTGPLGATTWDNSDTKFVIFGPYYKGFYGGYCTEYAARQFDAVAPSPKLNWSGHAQNWYANADSKGWKRTTDATAAVPGSIVVWSAGSFGHVGMFRSFTRDKSNKITHINVQEQNWGTLGTTTVDKNNAITANFGVVTSQQLAIKALDRGSYKFSGIILPQRK